MRGALLFLAALPLAALDNSVTVHEASTTTQTARPTTISRFFAKGEFPSGTYPKPRVGGSVPGAWQVDPKTAWPDGSVQHAFISLRLDLSSGGSAVVDFVRDTNPCHLGNLSTCQAAALDEAGMLAMSWNGKLTATLNSISYSGDARTMLDSGKFTYWLRGPVVTQVLVEDLTAEFAFNFGWQWTGSEWTAPSAEQYKSLRPAFDLAFWPDPDGAGSLTAWAGVWIQTRLYNDATMRQQRLPVDMLNFEVGSTLTTSWSMCTSGCIATGAPTMQARRSFRKDAWSGTAPGDIAIDFNLPYIIHTRLIPQLDLSKLPEVATTYADAELTKGDLYAGPDIGWAHHEPPSSEVLAGNLRKDMGGQGGRVDLGLLTGWQVSHLVLMGHSGVTSAKKKEIFDKFIVRIADTATGMPMHYIETDTSTQRDSPADGQRYYFNWPVDTTTPALGRVISINARPSGRVNSSSEEFGSTIDRQRNVCVDNSSSPCAPDPDRNGWQLDSAHWPAVLGLNYLLSGNPFYQREQQYAAAWWIYWAASSRGFTSGRAEPWGLHAGFNSNVRARYWQIREMMYAALISQEPERSYFAQMVRYNDEAQEGFLSFTGGTYYPGPSGCTSPFNKNTETSAWCYARYWIASNDGKVDTSNPLRIPSDNNSGISYLNNGDRSYAGFMGYYGDITFGWIRQMEAFYHDGIPLYTGTQKAQAEYLFNLILNPDAGDSFFSTLYQLPLKINIGGGVRRFLQSWSEWKSMFLMSGALQSSISPSTTSFAVVFPDVGADPPPTNDPSYIQVGSEWMRYCGWSGAGLTKTVTVCFGGRGLWGSGAQSHDAGTTGTVRFVFRDESETDFSHGYVLLVRAGLSFLYDQRTPEGYTGRRVWEWYEGALQNQQNVRTNLMLRFVPRDSLDHFRVNANGSTATFRWSNRSVQACKLHIGETEPPTSSDASDTEVFTGFKDQKHTASDLDAGTYHYRVTCGTGRVSGTVTVE